jgi:hypothetical protein
MGPAAYAMRRAKPVDAGVRRLRANKDLMPAERRYQWTSAQIFRFTP